MVTAKRIETGRVSVLPDGRMDTTNAAIYIGRSYKTLANWRIQGTGPTYIRRGRIYYFKFELDEWLAGGRATSTAQARHQEAS